MKKTFFLAGILSVSVFLSLSLFRADGYSFGGCEEDCQKCHNLEVSEAKEILAKLKAPDAVVKDIRMSPIRGLWEVVIEDKGKPGIMYVGFSKKHIIGGSIYEVETALNKTQETLSVMKQAVERYVDVSKITLNDTLVMGDQNAGLKVVVFTDPDCPFCGKLHDELKKIVSERKDTAFFLKLMPLKFHPDAYWKSKSIMCGKSMQLLEDNFEKKPVPRPECETTVVDDNIKLGAELGITGTPTLVMPDGLVVVGAKDSKMITELILKHQPKKPAN
ncbi:MAG: DsbC family protein [Nitrospirae bacterium]|nr:DsbC family protein [Nitrospirota bacterium]